MRWGVASSFEVLGCVWLCLGWSHYGFGGVKRVLRELGLGRLGDWGCFSWGTG
jgi:hypothetical protein